MGEGSPGWSPAPGRAQASGADGSSPSGQPSGPRLVPAQDLEAIQRLLEDLGLRGYEAKVLLALLRLGSATPTEVASLSEVGRTSVYPVLEALRAKRLAEPISGRPATWASPGVEEVLNRLYSEREASIQQLRSRVNESREVLKQLAPDRPDSVLPFVHLIRDKAHTIQLWERLLYGAESELLMFSRPPYAWAAGDVNPAVLDGLERGVRMQVIYERSLVEDPAYGDYREALEIYLDAGVVGRVVDALPMKLEVFDRKVVLVSMDDPAHPEGGYPQTLCIEHPGYAAFQADAFEQWWRRARPYPRLGSSAGAGRTSRSTREP